MTGCAQTPVEPLPAAAAEEAPAAAAALLLAWLAPVEVANSIVRTSVKNEVERIVVVGPPPFLAFSVALVVAAAAAAAEDSEVR